MMKVSLFDNESISRFENHQRAENGDTKLQLPRRSAATSMAVFLSVLCRRLKEYVPRSISTKNVLTPIVITLT